MSNRTLVRRLELLEVELAPTDDEPAMTILLTSPGQLDQIIEVRGNESPELRRRPRPPKWNSGGGR